MSLYWLEKKLNTFLITFALTIVSGFVQAELVERLTGDLQVQQGNLAFGMQLDTPSGIHSMTPDLSISYSQYAGVTNMGAGFSLSSGASIQRCSANYKADGFYSGLTNSSLTRFCIGGNRLVAISGENGKDGTEYRIQSDNNSRIVSYGGSQNTPDYWLVQNSDGYKLTFERFGNTNDLHATWYVTKKEDVFNNSIDYKYTNSNSLFPSLDEITYGPFTVDFQYIARQSNATNSYQGGQTGLYSQKLDSIVFYSDISGVDEFLYEYRFAYEQVGEISSYVTERLKDIRKCYAEAGTEGCTKPLAFDYQPLPDPDSIAGGLDGAEDRTIVIDSSYYNDKETYSTIPYRPSYSSSDVNNDGIPDFCYFKPLKGVVCAVHSGVEASDYLEPVIWLDDDLGYEATEEDYVYYSNLIMMDLNSDGYNDVCINDDENLRCALNSKTGDFEAISIWSTFKSSDSVTFQNLNNDKLIDICGLDADSQYVCHENTGTVFDSTSVLLTGAIISHALDAEWGVPMPSQSICLTTDDDRLCDIKPEEDLEDQSVQLIGPQWYDIDGDLNTDLCWLNLKNEFICQKGYSNGVNKLLSEPEVQFSIEGLKTTEETDIALFSWQGNYAHSNQYYSKLGQLKSYVSSFYQTNSNFLNTWRPVDLNTDSLVDFCFEEDKHLKCHINNGDGFEAKVQLGGNAYNELMETYDTYASAIRSTMNLQDVNFDGLPDLCVVDNSMHRCAYNNGYNQFVEFKDRQRLAMDININESESHAYMNFMRKLFGYKTRFQFQSANTTIGKSTVLADINGDHFPEFCYRAQRGVLCTSMRNFGPRTLLTGVTDSYGNHTSVNYGMTMMDGLYESVASIPTGMVQKPSNKLVVESIVTDNGTFSGDAANTNTISYRYKGFATDPITGLEGYKSITTLDHARNLKRTSIMYLEEGLMGTERYITEYIDDVLVKRTQNVHEYIEDQFYSGVHKTRLLDVIESQYDLHGVFHSQTQISNKNFDEFNAPQRVVVNKTNDIDGQFVKTVTDSTFWHNTSNSYWQIGKPKTQIVTHTSSEHSSPVVKEVHYEYNSNGSVKNQIIEPYSIDKTTIHYVYENNGNLKEQSTTGNTGTNDNPSEKTRTQFFETDEIGRVTKAWNDLGHTTSTKYHTRCGGAEYEYDVNNRETFTHYNSYCEVDYVRDFLGNEAQQTTHLLPTPQTLTPVGLPIQPGFVNKAVYKVTASAPDSSCSIELYDSFDRKLSTKTCAEERDGNITHIVQMAVVDGLGLQLAGSIPYFEYPESIPATPTWQTFTYDRAGRILTENKMGPHGFPLTITHEYTANTHSTSNNGVGQGHFASKSITQNILGKPAYTIKDDLRIDYTYTAMGDIATTTTDGRTIEIVYDDKGQKSIQKDPSMGDWEYDYNAFGELIYQKDANGNVVTFEYDKIGRQVKRIEAEGETSWDFYETGPAIGAVKRETSINSETEFFYNDNGQLDHQILTVDDEFNLGEQLTLKTSYTYDSMGRAESTTTPDGVTKYVAYNAVGKVQSVQMPYEDFDDYNFDLLIEQQEALLTEIILLEAERNELLKKAARHQKKAAIYETEYLKYIEMNATLNGQEQDIKNAAQKYRNLAGRYQTLIEDLTDEMKPYITKWGDTTQFDYKGEKHGKHHFEYKTCVDTHALWRSCKKWQVNTIRLGVNNLLTEFSDNVLKYDIREVCDKHYLSEYESDIYKSQYRPISKDENGEYVNQCSAISPTMAIQEAIDAIADLKKRVENLAEVKEAALDKEAPDYELAQEKIEYHSGIKTKLEAARAPLSKFLIDFDELKEIGEHYSAAEPMYSGESSGNHKITNSWTVGTLDNCYHQLCPIVKDSKTLNLPAGNLVSHIPELSEEITFDHDFYCGVRSQWDVAQKKFIEIDSCTIVTRTSLISLVYEKMEEIDRLISAQNKYIADFTENVIAKISVLIPTTTKADTWVKVSEDPVVFEPKFTETIRYEWEDKTLGEAIAIAGDREAAFQKFMNDELTAHQSLVDNSLKPLLEALATKRNTSDYMSGNLAAFNIDAENLEALQESRDNAAPASGDALLTLWAVTERSPGGEILTELFGNGLVTKKTLNDNTGMIEKITTQSLSGEVLRNLSYTYTARGLVESKTDEVENNTVAENFIYDLQGRVIDWEYEQDLTVEQLTDVETGATAMTPKPNILNREYTYDDSGNLTEKITDTVGEGLMSFDPYTNRLLSRMVDGEEQSYSYDDNGNMLTGDGRTFDWTSFNKVKAGTYNGNTVEYKYNAGHNRLVKKVGNEVTYYIAPGYERTVKKTSTQKIVTHRHHIIVGNDVVATIEKAEVTPIKNGEEQTELAEQKPDQIGYYHRDLIGSGEIVTASDARLIRRQLYSPYGESIKSLLQVQAERNNIDPAGIAIGPDQKLFTENSTYAEDIQDAFQFQEDTNLASLVLTGTTTLDKGLRGYTSHEMIPELGLIHMNARLYDPVTGRFISADTIIPSIERPLSFNRYSYVEGNPVGARDPNGHEPFTIMAALSFYVAAHMTDSQLLQVASTIVLQAAVGGAWQGVFGAGPIGAGLSGAMTSWSMSVVTTGELTRDSVEAGLFAGLSAGVANHIGHGNRGHAIFGDDSYMTYAAHALSQGVIAMAQGQNVRNAMISSLVGHASGHMTGKMGNVGVVGGAAIAGINAAIVAEATGGDALEAAKVAMIIYLYNDAQEEAKEAKSKIKQVQDTGKIVLQRQKDVGNINTSLHTGAASVSKVIGSAAGVGIALLDQDVAKGVAAVNIMSNFNRCVSAGKCDLFDKVSISQNIGSKPPNYKAVADYFISKDWKYSNSFWDFLWSN